MDILHVDTEHGDGYNGREGSYRGDGHSEKGKPLDGGRDLAAFLRHSEYLETFLENREERRTFKGMSEGMKPARELADGRAFIGENKRTR